MRLARQQVVRAFVAAQARLAALLPEPGNAQAHQREEAGLEDLPIGE